MKLLKEVFLSFVFVLAVSACANLEKPAEDEVIVNISFKNMDVDSLTVGLFDLSKAETLETERLAVENGRFILKFKEDGVYMVYLSNPDSENWPRYNFYFYCSPGDVLNVNAEVNEYHIDYEVKGNEMNRQFMEYQNVAGQLSIDQSKALALYREALNDSMRSVILNDYLNARNQLKKVRLEFIKNHPNYMLSAVLLDMDEKQDILELYPVLTEEVKQSPTGKRLAQRVDIWSAVALGKMAPTFEYVTLDGETFSMDTPRSKYLVLNFWGTWCGPCMDGLPKMIEYYNKNSDKVDFVNIACRDSEERVRKVVEEQGVQWVQIINSMDNDLSKQYGIEGYPTKIIVNPQGIIEGIYLGSTPAIFNDLDVLLRII